MEVAGEKRKPSHDLGEFKRVCGDPRTLAITTSANEDALSLGFDRFEIAVVIRGIDHSMFVKSMTSYEDHRRWQDVYLVPTGDLVIYLKFTDDSVAGFRILSFKEK